MNNIDTRMWCKYYLVFISMKSNQPAYDEMEMYCKACRFIS